MVSEKVKLTYFDVYLSQTMWNHTKNSMKGLKQPTSVFLQWKVTDWQELFPKNAENKGNWNMNYSKVWTDMTYPGRTMWKSTSRGFQKCGSFRDLEVLNHSYRLSKSGQIQTWEGGVAKKRHGHNIEFWALIRNQRGTNMVGSTLIQWQRSKLIIVAVSFFFDTA